MTSLLLDTPVSGYQRECLLSVQSSASALLTIVNDILDLSKIASGHVRLDPAPLTLRTLLQRVTAPFSPQALAKGLQLTTTIARDVPDDYVADGGRLRQVLTNVIGNALKFTHDGGVTVTITCRERTADAARLAISVADTGIGIPPEAVELVFEPFRQADGSTTRAYGGTGLGLTISRRIAEMMGGRLWVESTVGVGSTFHIDVTLALAQGQAADAASPALRPAACPLRVLLAEDNVVNQRVAMGLLMARGHDVTVVHNGQEALDAVARSHFDVVLMDVQMPVMGGFEACQAIRAAEHTTGTRLRIVALTAHAMAGDRERCLAAGMDAVVTKPVHRELLYDAVEAVDKPLHA
jgi:CheY-like chemotaxis protein